MSNEPIKEPDCDRLCLFCTLYVANLNSLPLHRAKSENVMSRITATYTRDGIKHDMEIFKASHNQIN